MLVKIAPGKNANLWQDCLSGNYIRVGWDHLKLRDLRRYARAEDVVEEIRHSRRYAHSLSTASRIAGELWIVRNLEHGDQVVANKGLSEVLGVGTVTRRGYSWNENFDGYQHTVSVRWNPSYRKRRIHKQPSWRNTVVVITAKHLARSIAGKTVRGLLDGSIFEEVRRRRDASVRQRLGQNQFRRRLLLVYGSKCAVTGCRVAETLEAAHIYTPPGADQNDPSNGILLRADLHLLFDQMLWWIEPDCAEFRIRPADRLRTRKEYGKYHDREFQLPNTLKEDRFRKYLQQRARSS